MGAANAWVVGTSPAMRSRLARGFRTPARRGSVAARGAGAAAG